MFEAHFIARKRFAHTTTLRFFGSRLTKYSPLTASSNSSQIETLIRRKFRIVSQKRWLQVKFHIESRLNFVNGEPHRRDGRQSVPPRNHRAARSPPDCETMYDSHLPKEQRKFGRIIRVFLKKNDKRHVPPHGNGWKKNKKNEISKCNHTLIRLIDWLDDARLHAAADWLIDWLDTWKLTHLSTTTKIFVSDKWRPTVFRVFHVLFLHDICIDGGEDDRGHRHKPR